MEFIITYKLKNGSRGKVRLSARSRVEAVKKLFDTQGLEALYGFRTIESTNGCGYGLRKCRCLMRCGK